MVTHCSALLRLWCLQQASAQRGRKRNCRLAVLREPCLPIWRHVFQPRFVSLLEHRLPVRVVFCCCCEVLVCAAYLVMWFVSLFVCMFGGVHSFFFSRVSLTLFSVFFFAQVRVGMLVGRRPWRFLAARGADGGRRAPGGAPCLPFSQHGEALQPPDLTRFP